MRKWGDAASCAKGFHYNGNDRTSSMYRVMTLCVCVCVYIFYCCCCLYWLYISNTLDTLTDTLGHNLFWGGEKRNKKIQFLSLLTWPTL